MLTPVLSWYFSLYGLVSFRRFVYVIGRALEGPFLTLGQAGFLHCYGFYWPAGTCPSYKSGANPRGRNIGRLGYVVRSIVGCNIYHEDHLYTHIAWFSVPNQYAHFTCLALFERQHNIRKLIQFCCRSSISSMLVWFIWILYEYLYHILGMIPLPVGT